MPHPPRRLRSSLTIVGATAVGGWLFVGCSEVTILDHEVPDPCANGGCIPPADAPGCSIEDDGSVCDDDDPCTVGDTCAGTACTGTPVACEPREAECADAETLRTYGPGQCEDGGCAYTSQDEVCPNGCFEGECNLVRPMITLGYMHACALSRTGKVRCWGANGDGQLGYGHTETIGDDELPSSAGDVDVGGTVTQISAGLSHTCALLDTGAVRCWGLQGARYGYPTVETIGDDETPASMGDIDVGGPVIQIATGHIHTCALMADGTVRCWGAGYVLGLGHTQSIGDDESVSSGSLVDVGGVATRISVGASLSCALLTTGDVRCWGTNVGGRLGYGDLEHIGDDETPASMGNVPVGAEVEQIASEGGHHMGHMCVLTTGGRVRCWGPGVWGALGYEGTEDIGDDETPASAGDVDLDETVRQIATGGSHTCALLEDGAMRCWGNNGAGQLGGGSRTVDVPVSGDIASIVCGGGNTCALLENGAVRCWGDNQLGELGYGHVQNVYDAAAVDDVSIWD